jgi:hypothetical protein
MENFDIWEDQNDRHGDRWEPEDFDLEAEDLFWQQVRQRASQTGYTAREEAETARKIPRGESADRFVPREL